MKGNQLKAASGNYYGGNVKDYKTYIQSKSGNNKYHGFKPLNIPDYLYDFQKDLVSQAIEKGRSAIFADCGLGKSPMELVWGENVCKKTGGKVLLLTPLAVGYQMEKEAEKFGVSASRYGHNGKADIVIANYEKLHYFNPQDFTGIILDESSILKNFNGKIKHAINMFVRKIQYRLLATATAAPNDFIELGTSSEALGYLGYMDMLGRFFVNDQNNAATNKRGRFTEATKWRLKGHAENHFWRWVTSWARACRKPSDLGYDDDRFILPRLNEVEHRIDITRPPIDKLFSLPAVGLKEVRDERRATIDERCKRVADLVNDTGDYAVVWCNLNDEGDLLEKLISDSVQVAGRDTDESKEDKLLAFSKGNERVLVTKPKIGAWGLNWQHCNHVTFFPNYSYEQYYQAARRCWRFGQKREVKVDLIYTQGDAYSVANLRRKQEQADIMFTNLVAEMNNSLQINNTDDFTQKTEVPAWA